MEDFNFLALYCFIAIVSAVLAAANGGFEFEISAPGSLSVLGAFSLFYLLARII